MTILAFIVAILILVSLHEFGHYLVARLCGVKVVRFSVGFGKPFFKKKHGDTEWCLAPIPLGGYVKMVDTREGEVATEDLPFAFDKQHPLKRIAIVAAGPITNLILAVVLYGLSFSMGITEIRPLVGMIEPASIAAKAGFQSGDRILSVNDVPTDNWSDAQAEIVMNLEAQKVAVKVQTEQGRQIVRYIDLASVQEAADVAKNNGSIGMWPFRMTNQISMVLPNSPAQRAGLQKGDKLVSANGKVLPVWSDWMLEFRNNPGQKITIGYLRNGVASQTVLRPDSEEGADGTLIGKVGLAAEQDTVWREKVRCHFVPSWTQAFQTASKKVWHYSALTLDFFGKLITGKASLQHISGPVTIADVAGKSAAMGLQSYLEFLAAVSISLGVLNLLPIPVLDGGHLVYYTAEWIRGKPLSERVQMIGLRLGIAAMVFLMLVAFFNDITRLLG